MTSNPDMRERSTRHAWGAGAILFATLLLFAGGLTLSVINGSLPAALAVFLVAEMGFPIVGFFIVYRTRNLIGWIFLLTGLGLGLQSSLFAYGEYALVHHPGTVPGGVIAAWVSEIVWLPQLVLGTMLLFLFFPDGRLPSPRWRRVAAGGMVGTVLIELSLVFETTLYSYPRIRAPLAGLVPTFAVDLVAGIGSFLLLPAMLLAFVSLIFRFRSADQRVRLQIKWFIYAASAYFAVQIVHNLFEEFEDSTLTTIISGLSGLMVPVAVAIAIVRHRLYDIDRVINRTLVYAVLTAVLLGGYALVVVTISRLLEPLTSDSDVAIAASTLVVAALFGPVRARVQAFIDRRFYRRKYDALEALGQFSSRLRDQIDVDVVTSDVLGVIANNLQPAHAALWLKSPKVIE